MSFILPATTSKQEKSWGVVFDLQKRHPEGWTLIGGQMVHLHCAERGVFPTRSTDDADAVLDVRSRPNIHFELTTVLKEFGMRIDRPATINADTTGYIELKLEEENEPEYYKKSADIGIGFNYIRSERLTADIALLFSKSRVDYGSGYYDYETVSLPTSITWDRRDDMKSAKRGFWLSGSVTPFLGFNETGSGVRLTGEGRVYRSMLTDDRLTFAARARAGTVVGPNLIDIPPDYLFFSGGGGSVRGQPYESLGFDVPLQDTDEEAYVGGQSIVNLSVEARYQVREKIGAVVFVDGGQIWDEGVWQGETKSQSGAGIGVRYDTPIGPIRFDVATPIDPRDEDDSKVQLYLGLGQAF